MKKHTYIFASLLLVSGIILAQKGSIKRAHKLFEMRAYSQAAEIYETKPHTKAVLQNLADSYYYNYNFENAIKNYKELFNKYEDSTNDDSINKEYYFNYGQALKGVGNYTLADKFLSVYYNSEVNTKAFVEKSNKTTPHLFDLKSIDTQDSNGDFGLTFYNENIFAFTSARNTDRPKYLWNESPYLDLYFGILNGSVLDSIKPFPDVINTASHESNAIFTKDGKTMYFNRTNTIDKKIEKNPTGHIKIYKAELVNGNWVNVKALPFTSNEYSTEHPALSKDEKILYFASDMPGTIGSFDIYKVNINEDGSYGEPENLGTTINTEKREQFPFISDYNVLYFSSIGHEGFGGLDIFRSNLVNGIFDKPVNLGISINSSLDDFAYTIKEEDNEGFLSSNKSGNDKIYSFKREENRLTKHQFEGLVLDKVSKKLLEGTLVTLYDESNKAIQDTLVGKEAKYSFLVEPNKKYTIKGTRKTYIPRKLEFSADIDGNVINSVDLSLESFADAEKNIRINDKGVMQVDLEKIYFEFDKENINEGAALILDGLVDLMNKYPSMVIEISAHTDARGFFTYNMELSERRAASTLEYLVEKGIDRKRLKSIGYGETKPLNKCVRDRTCLDAEYEVNRRCEFTILN
ncbi:hypothetical protein APS56_12950 [Pseudalgibacter alginicilyticus]|uniref:OmpA-like domain-containing protein n=1 Tax=Pseudalgibacter alginicilyticus TaxID=1736674 RepID=A0A0P0DD76_9FLAO|nr:OmpA family protein [Pseudalgibacter alginicilyticus]ALJ05983.1 hypothetical protein APS56_12950 [Pseudalgibacter alginicilyticus]